jgi:D-alanyl-D-alanine carboxypeptidase/D-alanyl-D-alanine-endopeptidase (penicillin-binding protein 4)
MTRIILFLTIFIFSVTLLSCKPVGEKKQAVTAVDSTVIKLNEKARHDSLSVELDHFVHDPCFNGAVIGYTIYDFTKGMQNLLFDHNAILGMVPASTQKILTTAAALELFGEPIYQEVTITNLNSINWRANRLLQKIGQQKYGVYDFVHGTQAVMEYWKDKGIDISGLNMCDGSGRSHDNIASPKQLADVLYKMTSSPVFPVFYNSLPLAGISGTMHKWLIGSSGEGRIRAKTGSLGGVRSYAGYVSTLSGKKLIFTLIINNYSCRTKILKQRVEDFMLGMVNF